MTAKPPGTLERYSYPSIEQLDGAARYKGARVDTRPVKVAERSFQITSLLDAAELLDVEEYAREFIEADRAPYGLELWPVATLLAEYIVGGEPGEGRPALDLGCGLGLTAIAATLQGWQVLAVDHEPSALQFAAYNAAANGVVIHGFKLFDWHRPVVTHKFDRVFGADVLYQRSDHLPILNCLDYVLGDGGLALLADPRRSVADGFAVLAAQQGWSVDLASGTALNFEDRVIEGRIFLLRRRSDGLGTAGYRRDGGDDSLPA